MTDQARREDVDESRRAAPFASHDATVAPSATEIALLIVAYNGKQLIDECLRSVLNSSAMNNPRVRLHIVAVDNASTDGTADQIVRTFPDVTLIRSDDNLGFAGGNNVGWDHIRRHYPDTQYLYLLNQDTVVDGPWLLPLVDYLEAHAQCAAAQPLIVLHEDPQRVNTAGNRCHYLGFTFVTEYQEPTDSINGLRHIDAVSGSAVLLRTKPLQALGLFEPLLFMYCEDVDLSWKLRLAGHDLVMLPTARVQHKYAPTAPVKAYYYLERNRWWLLLVYYRWRTLAVLLAPLCIMELGQLLYGSSIGAMRLKVAAWRQLLSRSFRSKLRTRRRDALQHRRISDAAFMAGFTGTIKLPSGHSRLLKYVGNPLLGTYWAVAKRMIRW